MKWLKYYVEAKDWYAAAYPSLAFPTIVVHICVIKQIRYIFINVSMQEQTRWVAKTQIQNASKYIYGILHLGQNLIYCFFLQLYNCKICNYTFFLLDFCSKNIILFKELAHTGKITQTLKRINIVNLQKLWKNLTLGDGLINLLHTQT